MTLELLTVSSLNIVMHHLVPARIRLWPMAMCQRVHVLHIE